MTAVAWALVIVAVWSLASLGLGILIGKCIEYVDRRPKRRR